MRAFFAVALVAIIFCIVSITVQLVPTLYAETKVTIDLEELDDNARKIILDHKRKIEESKETANKKKEKVSDSFTKVELMEWANTVTSAIVIASRRLKIDPIEFSNSEVGKTSARLIAYKIILEDLKDTILVIVGWILITSILLFTFSRFHLPNKIIMKGRDENGNAVERVVYVPRYEWSDDASKGVSMVIHAVIFFIFTFFTAIMLFG